MTTLPLIADDVAATAATFQGVRKQLGLVPNLFRVVANSPAALQGYLGLSAALGRGVLPAALREQIALLVAQQNGCDYCLSAHAVIGAGAGLDEAAIQAARHGEAMTERDTAALALARAVLAGQGRGAEAALAAAQAAGWDAAAIVEIVQHVALNVFTNSLNNLVGTPIDFPVRSTAA
jgi:uncharacterized peroxidase-related enzyme